MSGHQWDLDFESGAVEAVYSLYDLCVCVCRTVSAASDDLSSLVWCQRPWMTSVASSWFKDVLCPQRPFMTQCSGQGWPQRCF